MSNKQTQSQDMKKVVEQLITNLKRNGVRVTSAAVLDLDTQQGQENAVDKAVENVLNKINRMKGQPLPPVPPVPPIPPLPNMPGDIRQEEAPTRRCRCGKCLTFETFEKVFGEPGSIFDYGEVTLNKITFQIKYHLSPDGEENVMAQKKPETIDYSNLSIEELEVELSKSVQNKEFVKSQLLLNAIQQLKNKNQ